eukprot:6208681-Pleurochrysis_carterae.AAC.2
MFCWEDRNVSAQVCGTWCFEKRERASVEDSGRKWEIIRENMIPSHRNQRKKAFMKVCMSDTIMHLYNNAVAMLHVAGVLVSPC